MWCSRQKATTKYLQSSTDKAFCLFGVYERVFPLRGRTEVNFLASVAPFHCLLLMIWSVVYVHNGVVHLKIVCRNNYMKCSRAHPRKAILLYLNVWHEATIFTFHSINTALYTEEWPLLVICVYNIIQLVASLMKRMVKRSIIDFKYSFLIAACYRCIRFWWHTCLFCWSVAILAMSTGAVPVDTAMLEGIVVSGSSLEPLYPDYAYLSVV